MNEEDQEPEGEEDVDVEGDGEGDGEDEQEGGKKRRLSPKFLLMFIAAPVLLLGGIGGGGAWYMGWLGGSEMAADGTTQAAEAAKPSYFYDLPEMLVNLSQRDKRAQYLKLQVALEMANEDIATALEPVLPRIMDTFQVYLRELRSSDLDGSAGVYRLKEELLRRVNLSIAPRKVDRVLFKEIIIQ